MYVYITVIENTSHETYRTYIYFYLNETYTYLYEKYLMYYYFILTFK